MPRSSPRSPNPWRERIPSSTVRASYARVRRTRGGRPPIPGGQITVRGFRRAPKRPKEPCAYSSNPAATENGPLIGNVTSVTVPVGGPRGKPSGPVPAARRLPPGTCCHKGDRPVASQRNGEGDASNRPAVFREASSLSALHSERINNENRLCSRKDAQRGATQQLQDGDPTRNNLRT